MTMLTKLSPLIKINLFLAGTALIVAYVRTFLQYHRYGWESIGQVITSWLVHYFAIAIVLAISYAFISTKSGFFLNGTKEHRKLTAEEGMLYGSMVLLVTAVFLFVIMHLAPHLNLDDLFE